MQSKEKGGSRQRAVTVSLAKPFHMQRVKDTTGSATENAERWECRQEEKKTFLHGFYYGHVFHGSRGFWLQRTERNKLDS